MKKLYKVEIRYFGKYKTSYVVANHPTEAYDKVRKYLDDNDLCFEIQRELESITLIADSSAYPGCENRLYL